jgi:predicted small metal-binding protein
VLKWFSAAGVATGQAVTETETGSHILQTKEAIMSETRKVVDCRLYPSEKGCTLTIEGTEEEVLEAATNHAITAHGHTNSPELREKIKSIIQDVEE